MLLHNAAASFQSIEMLGGAATPYTEAARALGIEEGAVKSAIFRMRRRYGEILRDEISETVNNAADVEDEIRYLIAILAEQG